MSADLQDAVSTSCPWAKLPRVSKLQSCHGSVVLAAANGRDAADDMFRPIIPCTIYLGGTVASHLTRLNVTQLSGDMRCRSPIAGDV